MATIELTPDFKDFLRLINSYGVKYLLVGGYAVICHGYPRSTGDMDIWIEISESNAEKMAEVVRDFAALKDVTREVFLERDKVIRMGMPPVRIEVITSASGVDFADCFSRREIIEFCGVQISIISLQDLKVNKKAAGRLKDLTDLEHLP